MNANFMALDIETAKPFPNGDDWRPLGIACAVTAVRGQDEHHTQVWTRKLPDGSAAPR